MWDSLAMKLRKYFLPMDAAARLDFANRCDTSPKQLLNICGGKRPCSPELAINIERESKGACTVEELAPVAKKIRVDWQYIRGAKRPRRSEARAV
jgi:DNA-binding transcriptional regulator YdaS (Cro superfamily)